MNRTIRDAAMSRKAGRLGFTRATATLACVSAVTASLLVGGATGAVADTSPSAGVPATASAYALPTVQIDGVVWTQVVVGNKVFVGGNFTKARPYGAPLGDPSEVSRTYLLAYDITTGELDPTFAPVLNGQVKDLALSPDGSTLYVGGMFTTIDGLSRTKLAAFNTNSGALLAWQPTVNGGVSGLAASESAVFIGGSFTVVGGQPHDGAAAISTAANAAVLPFNPIVAGGDPQAVAVSPDGSKVVIGGNFTTVNGSGNPGYGLAVLDAATGASLPAPVNGIVRDAGTSAGISDLRATANGFYGSGWTYTRDTGNLEGTFKADWNGNLQWLEDCHGDSYNVFPDGDVVYQAGHAHYCGNVGGFPQPTNWVYYRGLAFTDDVRGTVGREHLGYFNFEGQPRPDLLHWFPDINVGTFTGMSQGPWSISGNDAYVVYGGEFTRVDGRPQQGLVRFAKPGTARTLERPEANIVPKFADLDSGRARLMWTTAYDRDSEALTYRVYRDGARIATLTSSSSPWNQPELSLVDTGLVPGQAYSYRIAVVDPDGNSSGGTEFTHTYVPGATPSAYDTLVHADNPTWFWRLDESSGTAADSVNGWTGNVGTLVTRGVAGAIAGSAGTAFQFNPTNTSTSSTVIPQSRVTGASVFTAEAWFKSTSTRGGAIVNFGTSLAGNSATSTMDRVIYLTNDGRLQFGVNPGQIRTVASSTTGLNNGAWHHVVATLDPTGMKLYVDGQLSGSRTDTTQGRNFDGVWRIGGDRLSGWTSNPSSSYLSGAIDQVAVYARALPADRIAAHYSAGRTGQLPNQLPTAAFSASASDLTVAVDASASTDPDGTIASYTWNFGDGTTGSGKTASHTYAAAGTYTVTLSVTDDKGGVSSPVQKSVTAKLPNVAPTAAFTHSANQLSLSVDASGSSDPDGSIASYKWDFGDGTPGSGPTATHVYAASGTYAVKLVVTDDAGATGQVTTSVSVSAPNQAPTASFTVSQAGMRAVTVDAEGSSDPDGSVSDYAWDFGDGSTGSGKTTNHTYATGGTFTVTLVVTDNEGLASQPLAKQVGVLDVYAADDFDRTVTRWGTAVVGGDWTYVTPSVFSTNGQTGTVQLPTAGSSGTAVLANVSAADTDTFFTLKLDQAPTGSGVMSTMAVRRQGTSEYIYTVQVHGDTTVRLNVTKKVNGVSTNLGDVKVAGLTYQAGDVLNVRFVAKGTGTTVLSGYVWKEGSAVPSSAQISKSDSSPELQGPGSFSLRTYLTGSATSAATVGYDDLVVKSS